MVQEIIVAIIGIGIGLLLIYKIYSFFFLKKKDNTLCGCASCHCNPTKK